MRISCSGFALTIVVVVVVARGGEPNAVAPLRQPRRRLRSMVAELVVDDDVDIVLFDASNVDVETTARDDALAVRSCCWCALRAASRRS